MPSNNASRPVMDVTAPLKQPAVATALAVDPARSASVRKTPTETPGASRPAKTTPNKDKPSLPPKKTSNAPVGLIVATLTVMATLSALAVLIYLKTN